MRILLLFFLLLTFPARAEYRMFELVIQNTANKSERIIISSLDPLQYPDYYDLRQGEIAMYRDTWMCWGDTSQGKRYCKNPKLNQSPEKQPESRTLASP